MRCAIVAGLVVVALTITYLIAVPAALTAPYDYPEIT